MPEPPQPTPEEKAEFLRWRASLTPEQLAEYEQFIDAIKNRVPTEAQRLLSEADAIPLEDRAALCCAADHPLSWTAATGEVFTITKPKNVDGVVCLDVICMRDGVVIHAHDHHIHGLTDFYGDFASDPPAPRRDWVASLRTVIEGAALR